MVSIELVVWVYARQKEIIFVWVIKVSQDKSNVYLDTSSDSYSIAVRWALTKYLDNFVEANSE